MLIIIRINNYNTFDRYEVYIDFATYPKKRYICLIINLLTYLLNCHYWLVLLWGSHLLVCFYLRPTQYVPWLFIDTSKIVPYGILIVSGRTKSSINSNATFNRIFKYLENMFNAHKMLVHSIAEQHASVELTCRIHAHSHLYKIIFSHNVLVFCMLFAGIVALHNTFFCCFCC